METINKKYKVTAQVLTPLSIGQGSENDWVYGVDYLVKTDPRNPQNRLLYHLDLNKMVAAGVDMVVMSNFLASNNVQGVQNLVGNKLDKVSDFSMPLPNGIGNIGNNGNGLSNPVKTFLRNDLTNRPILAGSSLKGALRSVLFSDLRTNERDNASVFGDMKNGTDFMRFVRVGDLEFAETCLINTKIYNLHNESGPWQGGWKHKGGANGETTYRFKSIGFNTVYECLPPQAISEGYIMFADKLFSKVVPQGNVEEKKKILHDIIYLCDKINDHTFEYLNKELEFFQKYEQGEKCSQIEDCIKDIQNGIDACEGNECILKMSAGAGFHSITGDWRFTDYTGNDGHTLGQGRYHRDLPKSRKIAVSGSNPFSLMGFIKLTFTETK